MSTGARGAYVAAEAARDRAWHEWDKVARDPAGDHKAAWAVYMTFVDAVCDAAAALRVPEPAAPAVPAPAQMALFELAARDAA